MLRYVLKELVLQAYYMFYVSWEATKHNYIIYISAHSDSNFIYNSTTIYAGSEGPDMSEQHGSNNSIHNPDVSNKSSSAYMATNATSGSSDDDSGNATKQGRNIISLG